MKMGSSPQKNISEFVYIGILLAVFMAVLSAIDTSLTGTAAQVVNAFETAISANLLLVGVVFLVIIAVWVLGYVQEMQKKTKG